MISVVFALIASAAAASGQVCTPSYGGHSVNAEVTAPDMLQVNLKLVGVSSPIVIEVNRSWSPVGADHFYALFTDGYFDCAAFYHTNASYAQTGIAAAKDYSSKWEGYIADDDDVVRKSNTQYMVSYAPFEGRGTRSTHIMIHLQDNSYLDDQGFYPFAQVVDGFDALTSLAEKKFELVDGEAESYFDGGNEWLFSVYSPDDMTLISSIDVRSSSGGGGDRSGSWAFGVIMTVLSSAACIAAVVYIYRHVRRVQGYDMALDDSRSDGTISLNLQQSSSN